MRYEGEGFGKVILFGEHFVVYGLPGVVAGLDRGITVRVEEGPFRIGNGWDQEITRKAADRIISSISEKTYSIEVEENIPSGAGLGASAAFSVGLAKAISKAEGKKLTDEEIFTISLEAEKMFHGNPSGIDNAAATYGGVMVFKKGEKPKRFTLGRELNLLITYTGKKGSTKEMVSKVAELKGQFEGVFERILETYRALANDGIRALEQGSYERIGSLMNINHGLLSSVGVSTKEIEEIVHSTRENGAYGSKITGAGGGGCVISLVENEKAAKDIASTLSYESFFAKVG